MDAGGREMCVNKTYAQRLIDAQEFMDLVREMRHAQKEANDMIAQAECYQEAIEYIKKAEVIENAVDNWIKENM